MIAIRDFSLGLAPREFKVEEIEYSKKLKDTCHFSLTVNDCVLDRETTFTYLGIVFNEKLSWADHIEFVRQKVNQRRFCVGLSIFSPSTLVISL